MVRRIVDEESKWGERQVGIVGSSLHVTVIIDEVCE